MLLVTKYFVTGRFYYNVLLQEWTWCIVCSVYKAHGVLGVPSAVVFRCFSGVTLLTAVCCYPYKFVDCVPCMCYVVQSVTNCDVT